jgi:hypothetical protein
MLQFLHLFAPPLLLLLELPIHSQQFGYLALLLLNHFLVATIELAYHCLQHLHAVHPAVLQQGSQLRLVQLQILQMLHESAMRRLQRLHQIYNVLRSVQREVLDVNVEGRHHFQLRLHRRGQFLQLCLRTEGAALGWRGTALMTFHNKIISSAWTRLSQSNTSDSL